MYRQEWHPTGSQKEILLMSITPVHHVPHGSFVYKQTYSSRTGEEIFEYENITDNSVFFSREKSLVVTVHDKISILNITEKITKHQAMDLVLSLRGAMEHVDSLDSQEPTAV
jgi:hypothetical protein